MKSWERTKEKSFVLNWVYFIIREIHVFVKFLPLLLIALLINPAVQI